jgi:hypothetical protein
VQSIFTRPRARPPLAAVSSQQNMLAVSTEDELLAALTSLPRSDGACYGRAINIVADITLTRTVTLGAQHSGLLITSSSNARLNTASPLAQAFSLSAASSVTLERMVLGATFSSTSFVRIDGNGHSVKDILVLNGAALTNLVRCGSASSMRIMDCYSQSSLSVVLAVGPSSGIGNCVFSGNVLFTGGIQNVSLTKSAIYGNSSLGGWTTFPGRITEDCACYGNIMTGLIGIYAGAGRNVIASNSMNGFDIDTSATTGNNSIVGNTNVGTITNASTDAVTSNT